MITNHILEDKWRVQRALSDQARNDPGKYIALAHQKAMEAQERYGIRFRYVEADLSSGPEPLTAEASTKPRAAQ